VHSIVVLCHLDIASLEDLILNNGFNNQICLARSQACDFKDRLSKDYLPELLFEEEICTEAKACSSEESECLLEAEDCE
jgi:hypothetical protein